MSTGMLQPSSTFSFGKYKGKTVMQVAEENPGYLCWMRRTGFQNFGKEVTEAIFAWEEANPEEVKRIDRSIAKKKGEEAAKMEEAERGATHTPLHDPAPPPVIAAHMSATWGSW